MSSGAQGPSPATAESTISLQSWHRKEDSFFLSPPLQSPNAETRGLGRSLGSFQSHRLSREQAKTEQGWHTYRKDSHPSHGRDQSQLFVAVAVQSLSRVWLFATPWIAAHQASPSFTISMSLLKLMPIELVMPCYHLSLWLLLSSCSQSFPALGTFAINSSSHQVAQVLELQLQQHSSQ